MAVDYYNGNRAYCLGPDWCASLSTKYIWLCNNIETAKWKLHICQLHNRAEMHMYVTFENEQDELMYLLACQ